MDPFGLSRDGDSKWIQGGDFLVDLVPYVGAAKGFQQAFTGYNMVTGQQLSTADHWAEGIGSTMSWIPIPGLKHVGKYGTEGAFLAGKTIRNWTGGASRTGSLKMDLQFFASQGTGKVPGMPPIVQSRINISNDGWEHVVKRHFSNKNASQFTISQDELRSLLSSKGIVKTPIKRSLASDDGVRYVREVTLDKPIGLDKFNGFKPTSTMTILTDKRGNLVTATPGVIK